MVLRPLKEETRSIFCELLKQEGVARSEYIRNPVKIDGNTATVYILEGKIIHEMLIDTNSLKKIAGTVVFNNGHAVFSLSSKLQSVSRMITNCSDDRVVFHINNNKLDNRLQNLKKLTKSQYFSELKADKSNNIVFDGKTYRVTIGRSIKNKELAEELLIKATELFNHYSNLDANK